MVINCLTIIHFIVLRYSINDKCFFFIPCHQSCLFVYIFNSLHTSTWLYTLYHIASHVVFFVTQRFTQSHNKIWPVFVHMKDLFDFFFGSILLIWRAWTFIFSTASFNGLKNTRKTKTRPLPCFYNDLCVRFIIFNSFTERIWFVSDLLKYFTLFYIH